MLFKRTIDIYFFQKTKTDPNELYKQTNQFVSDEP